MPIDTRERPYVPREPRRLPTPSSPPASTPTAGPMRRVLRSLRIRNFAGELLDDPGRSHAAAADAGIADELDGWLADPEVEAELERRCGARPPADARRAGARPQARQLVRRAAATPARATRSPGSPTA